MQLTREERWHPLEAAHHFYMTMAEQLRSLGTEQQLDALHNIHSLMYAVFKRNKPSGFFFINGVAITQVNTVIMPGKMPVMLREHG